MSAPEVAPGQVWRHYNGGTYRVLMLANEHGSPERQVKYPITVVYQSEITGRIWARYLRDWHRSMELVL